tara:strand:+ start:75 stop:491 length:417 start_codon:yes stop_codon:yes gene_type:complete
MFKIYCIEDINGNKYIGSTSQPLNIRLIQHKNKDNGCSSNKLDLYNSFIYTIEECNREDKREREKYWINNTDCVNIRKFNFNQQTYRQNNKKKIKIQQMVYDQKRLESKKQLYNYKNSWGGNKRYNNNLLEIDIDVFA